MSRYGDNAVNMAKLAAHVTACDIIPAVNAFQVGNSSVATNGTALPPSHIP